MTDWSSLYDAVKDVCRSGLWAQGVGLARDGAVSGSGDGSGGGVWTFRVGAPGPAALATVTLHPGDVEWDCDCGSRIDPCAHVAAAAIAVRQDPDAVLTAAAARRHVRYDLTVAGDAIALQRWLATPDGAAEPVADLAASDVALAEADVVLDRLLRDGRTRAIPAASFGPFLRALAEAEDVRLAGEPVRVSRDPAFPKARVQDAADGGVEVVVAADPGVTAVVAPGVVRTGDTLRPMGVTGRYGARWERLPARRRFAPAAFAEVVGRVLPELEREIDVEVATTRLPGRTGATPPWIRFNVETVEQAIEVRPELVYGDPPVALVEAGRLVHLRGAVSRRDEAAEHRLELRLRDDVHLALGRRVRLAGADAARLLSAIHAFDDGRPAEVRARTTDVALKPRLVGDGADVTVMFEAADGAHRATAEVVVAAWRDGLSLVPLDGGGFGTVPAAWLAQHGHLVTELLSARDAAGGPVPRAALSLVAEVCEALDQPPPFSVGRMHALLDRTEAEVPSDFTGTLRPYQRDGVAWLAFASRCGPGRRARRRHGPRQDASRRSARCAAARWSSCPTSVVHNWSGGDRALPPGAHASRSTTAPRARSTRRRRDDHDATRSLRLDADVLAADALGHRSFSTRRRRSRTPTARSARAAFGPCDARLAPVAVRHAGREPPRRAVEPDALRQPRPARRARATSRSATQAPIADGRRRRGSAAAASASGRSCCAA